jgi:hypothetical protein
MSFFASRPANQAARLLSAAASVNATLVVARPCALKGIQGYNARASAVFLKLYDKAAAPSEADAPVKTLYLPATSAFAFDFTAGFECAAGLGFRLTTAGADNSNDALSAGDIVCLNLDYL